eukprot:gene16446-7860_t
MQKKSPIVVGFHVQYTCCEQAVNNITRTVANSTTKTTYSTHSKELTHLSIDCKGGFLIGMKLQLTESGTKIHYDYECAVVTNLLWKGQILCFKKYTPWQDNGNGNIIYLDRLEVNCDQEYVLQHVELRLMPEDSLQWRYESMRSFILENRSASKEEMVKMSHILRLLWVFALLSNGKAMILRLPCLTLADFAVIKSNFMLNGHVFMNLSGVDDVGCAVKCTENHRCRSYNILIASKICELSDRAFRDKFTNNLTETHGWIYKSTDYNKTKVGPTCERLRPCGDDVLCREKCEPPFYECVHCSSGYYGLHCDQHERMCVIML